MTPRDGLQASQIARRQHHWTRVTMVLPSLLFNPTQLTPAPCCVLLPPAARSASHLELFALSAPQPKTAETGRPPLAEVQVAVVQAVIAKTMAAKEQEAAALVAGVAAKYALSADYGKVEETIKAVWAEPPVGGRVRGLQGIRILTCVAQPCTPSLSEATVVSSTGLP